MLFLMSSLASLTVIDAKPTKVQGCDLKHVRLSDLPSGQHNVTIGRHAVPKFVTIGAGVQVRQRSSFSLSLFYLTHFQSINQNYTCQDNVYVSIGAVAKLFDISCLAGHHDFNTIQYFALHHHSGEQLGKEFFGGRKIHPIIDHDFVTNPVGEGIAPRFDLAGTHRFTTLKKDGVS